MTTVRSESAANLIYCSQKSDNRSDIVALSVLYFIYSLVMLSIEDQCPSVFGGYSAAKDKSIRHCNEPLPAKVQHVQCGHVEFTV